MQDNDDVRSKLKSNAEKQGLDRKLESTDKKTLIQAIQLVFLLSIKKLRKLRIKYLMLVEQLLIILLIKKVKMFENKLPDVSRLVSNTAFNRKITEIEKKFLLC